MTTPYDPKPVRLVVEQIICFRRDVSYEAGRKYERESKNQFAATEEKAGDECQLLLDAVQTYEVTDPAHFKSAVIAAAYMRHVILFGHAEKLRANGSREEAACYQCAGTELRYISELLAEIQ